MEPPKVFISHASEDKERFVLDFAKRLCENGIDPWVDKWEILPGDSIIDKIFEEGIRQAQAVIVVLSKYSINKRWVQEELNASLVKRIQRGSRLIPVILDIDEDLIPQSLRSIAWVKIDDLQHYEKHLKKIVDAIYNRRGKPTISVSQNLESKIKQFSPLKKTTSTIFKLFCEKALNNRHGYNHRHIHLTASSPIVKSFLEELKSKGVTPRSVFKALTQLEQLNYIIAKAEDLESPYKKILSFVIKLYAFDKYLKENFNNYLTEQKRVGIELVKEEHAHSRQLAESLNLPHVLIIHLFEIWDEKGFIHYNKSSDFPSSQFSLWIDQINSSFKEWLKTI